MRKIIIIFMVLTAFALSACFRNAGGDTPTVQPVSMAGNDFTDPTTESLPPSPTEVAVEPTEEATEEPTEAPTEAPTEEPTEEPTDVPTEVPTEAPTEVAAQKPTEEILSGPEPVTNSLTTATPAPAEVAVVQATFTTVPLGVGQGGGLVVPTVAEKPVETATPVPTDVPPTEIAQVETALPGQLTATAIFMEATQTQSAMETLDAGGVPGQVGEGGQASQVGAPTATQQYPDCEHMVQIGETLSQISVRYNLSIAEIANANNITNPDLIRAGYPIIIPGCGQIPPTPTPITTTDDSQKETTGAQDNSAGPFVYTVQAGDNIYRLSLRYGVGMLDILNANPQITNMNLIAEGDQITIPGPPTNTPVQNTTVPTPAPASPIIQPSITPLPATPIPQPTVTPLGSTG